MEKMLRTSAILSGIIGIILIVTSLGAISFTYTSIARENIVTPADARMPGKHVRGPITLKAQADIIRVHVLKMTDGKTYAEMPREDKQRDLWITATTLTTALNLGILTYGLSALTLLLGCMCVWMAFVFYALSKKLV